MIIYCDSSKPKLCVLFEGGKPLFYPHDHEVTINEGEYLAVLKALELAHRYGFFGCRIVSDSQLVVNQLTGKARCFAEKLVPLNQQAQAKLKEVNATIEWRPRERNEAGHYLPGQGQIKGRR